MIGDCCRILRRIFWKRISAEGFSFADKSPGTDPSHSLWPIDFEKRRNLFENITLWCGPKIIKWPLSIFYKCLSLHNDVQPGTAYDLGRPIRVWRLQLHSHTYFPSSGQFQSSKKALKRLMSMIKRHLKLLKKF